jgi:esterase
MNGCVRLHFREYGKGDPLVILHGLCGSLDNWHTVSRRLAARFHVLAVDQRNHGQSPHHEEMGYARMAEDLSEFFGEQSIAKAPVMGHSMGGKTAMQFAFDFPDKISRLIVVDMAPRAYEPVHRQALEALLAVDLASCPTRQDVETAMAAAIPEPAVRQFLLKNLARSSGGFRWKLNLPNILQNYSLLHAAIGSSRPSVTPALFIRGGRSDFVQAQDVAAIRRCFPRAQLCTIEAAGHWVQADAPEALAACVEQFLKPAAAGGGSLVS